MNNNNVTTYLVTTPSTSTTKENINFINNTHRSAQQVQTMNAQTVFTTDKAFACQVQQYEGKRYIIVERNKISTVAFKLAKATKIPFGLIVRTNNTLKLKYINKVNNTKTVRTTRKIAVGTANS